MTDFEVKEIDASAPLSAPGATFIKLAFSLSMAIDAFEATEVTTSPRFLKILLIRKKTIGDSSSGSKATKRT